MKKMRQVKGIVPVLSTPFTSDENIDVEGLKRLVGFLITQNIAGLWVLGTGSEDMNLSFEKRLKVAKAVTEANAGRVPLMLGAAFFALEDTMASAILCVSSPSIAFGRTMLKEPIIISIRFAFQEIAFSPVAPLLAFDFIIADVAAALVPSARISIVSPNSSFSRFTITLPIPPPWPSTTATFNIELSIKTSSNCCQTLRFF